MPEFQYRGTDEKGVERQGVVEADGLVAAAERLRQDGVIPLRLDRKRLETERPQAGELDRFSFFNRSLAALARTGIPLPTAVGRIASGMKRGRFRKELEGIESAMKEGKTMDEAVAASPGSFPNYYTWMLRAGAASGNLPSVLMAVARVSEGFRRSRNAIMHALSYPAIVLGFGTLMVVSFLIFFLPLYQELFRAFDLEPGFALGLMLDVFRGTIVPVVLCGGTAGGLVVFVIWLRKTASGERFLFRIPILGPVARSLKVARFFGTLSVLLDSGATLREAVPVSVGASDSRILLEAQPKMESQLGEGGRLGEILEGTIPAGITGYVRVAEETGRLREASGEISDLLMEQVGRGSDTLFLVLFPVSILITGAIMAAVYLALVSPYFHLLSEVHP